jgi:hypothetical protein
MNHKTLKKLWNGLLAKAVIKGVRPEGQRNQPRVDPFTVGLRIDLPVPSGAGTRTVASQFVWVSPTECPRSAKTLRVLLLPN